MCCPDPVGPRRGHHLPDRFEHVGGRAQLERATHERRREVDLADARRYLLLHVHDGLLGDAGRPAYAGDLVCRLDQVGGADHRGGIHWLTTGKQLVRRPAHCTGHLVHRHRGTRRDQLGDHPREMLDPLVEFEIQRAVLMICGHLRFRRCTLAVRHEKMRVLVGGQHDRHWALHVGEAGVHQGPCGSRRVHNVAVHQQYQHVDPVICHRGPQPRTTLAIHARPVRFFRDVDGGCRSRQRSHHPRPRNLLMLPLQTRAALSAPSAATTAVRDFSE